MKASIIINDFHISTVCVFKSRRLLHENFFFVPDFSLSPSSIEWVSYRTGYSLFANFISQHILSHTSYHLRLKMWKSICVCDVYSRTEHSTAQHSTVTSLLQVWVFPVDLMQKRCWKKHTKSLWVRTSKKSTIQNREKRTINFVLEKYPFFMFKRDKIDWKMIYLGAGDIFIGLSGCANTWDNCKFKSVINIIRKIYIGYVANIQQRSLAETERRRKIIRKYFLFANDAHISRYNFTR